MPLTVVAVNAHPDDEAILMGGTLARLSAAGHRVVLVIATDGDAGVASSSYAMGGGLGVRRLRELRASAMALGVAEVIDLGYGDSGMGPTDLAASSSRPRLHTVPVDTAATRVAAVLADQSADIVIGYDRAGGYGHRDHVRVHRIVRRAVERLEAQHPVRLLEATAPREPIVAALQLLRRLGALKDFDPQDWATGFTPSAQITHRVDVRKHIHAKRAALNAHISQRSSDGGRRSMAWVRRMPAAFFALVLGREYFVEPGRDATPPPGFDAFADLTSDAA